MTSDRMPPIAEPTMSSEQKLAAAALTNGPRGGLRGPFISMLRSPEFMNRAQLLGEYLRFNSVILQRYREFAILVTARHWQQTYEWNTHKTIAIKEGVSAEWLEQLGEHGTITGLTKDYQVIYDFCTELHNNHCTSDNIYKQADELLGEQGIVELCGICGYYAMLAMLLNVAQTPVPGSPSLPFTLPVAD